MGPNMEIDQFSVIDRKFRKTGDISNIDGLVLQHQGISSHNSANQVNLCDISDKIDEIYSIILTQDIQTATLSFM